MQIQRMNIDVTNLGYSRTWDILRYWKNCCENRPGLGVKCHYYSLLTGLSSIFKDSSLQVRSLHREYSTGSSTTVYLTILQDRLHDCELFSVYICVCSLQYLVVFSRLAVHLPHSIFSHVLLVIIHNISLANRLAPHLHTVLLRKTRKTCRYYTPPTFLV